MQPSGTVLADGKISLLSDVPALETATEFYDVVTVCRPVYLVIEKTFIQAVIQLIM